MAPTHILLLKAKVRAHTRRMGGRLVYVRDYRTRVPPAEDKAPTLSTTHQMDLFAQPPRPAAAAPATPAAPAAPAGPDLPALDDLPEGATFRAGDRPLTRGKWRIEGPGRIGALPEALSNWHDTPKAALAQAREWQANRRVLAENQAAQAAHDAAVVAKVRAGGELTDADLKGLDLKPRAHFAYISPVVQRLFGISRAKVREAMGNTIRREVNGMNTAYVETVDTRRALANAAAFGRPAPLPQNPTETDAFRRWFAGSKVTEPDGRPKRVYHGTIHFTPETRAEGIRQFDRRWTITQVRRAPSLDAIGSWFSSSTAENGGSSLYAGGGGTSKEPTEGAATYPVYLAIRNPLVFQSWRDGDRWRDPFDGLRQVWDAYHRAREKAGTLDARTVKDRSRNSFYGDPDGFNAHLRDKGYDGVILRDFREGNETNPSQDVFIALDPGQIKSAVGNRGTWNPDEADLTKAARLS